MDKLINDFSFGLFFWQLLLFLLLLFILRRFAWKPILNAVNEREKTIEDSLNQAKQAREEMANLKSENEKILKEAKIERDVILKEARTMKDNIIAKAKESAQVEADRLVEIAREAIQNEKSAAMTELKNQIAALSIDVAEKVLNKELSDKAAQETLAKEMIKETKLN